MSRQNYYRNENRDWRRSSAGNSGYGRSGYASDDYNDGYNGSHRNSRRSYGNGGGNYGDRSNRGFYDGPDNYRSEERTRDNWNDRTNWDRDREDYHSSHRNRGNYSGNYDQEKNDSRRNYSKINYSGDSGNYSRNRDNDHFFKRAGRRIKDTWNDWSRNDHDNYYRGNDNYRGRRNFNEYDPENTGYQGRNSNDYRSSRYSDHDYYNPSRNERSERYYDNDRNPNYRRNSNNERNYGYYESYPNYGGSSRYADQDVRPYRNSESNRFDDYYNGQSRSETNAYTPISEY